MCLSLCPDNGKYVTVSLAKVIIASALFSATFSALFTGIAVNRLRNADSSQYGINEDLLHHRLQFGESIVVPEAINFKIMDENHSTTMIVPNGAADDNTTNLASNNRVLRGWEAGEEATNNIFNVESEYIYACSKEKGDKVRFVETLDECKKNEIGHKWSRNVETGKFIGTLAIL